MLYCPGNGQELLSALGVTLLLHASNDFLLFKGPITWQISARAEISARLGGLRFQLGFLNKSSLNDVCDYLKKVSARAEISSPVFETRH